MPDAVSIALIGDYNEEVTAHQAIPPALEIAAKAQECQLQYHWIETAAIDAEDCEQLLSSFNGFWCVPASPYRNKPGALNAIRYARENNKPFLGTCGGGYQHAVLEFARHALGHQAADNLEDNPGTDFPLVAPMSCPLREVAADIYLHKNTRLASIYGATSISEQYNCGFGINREYLALFKGSALQFSAVDALGDVRAFEIEQHPFFFGVAFQPERSALREQSHPLVSAFVSAARPHPV